MENRATSQRALLLCGILVAFAGAKNLAQCAERSNANVSPKAERLVADALRAEINGNSALRRVLLSEAVDVAPDFMPARWQSGQLLVGDQWLPVDKAQQVAAADPKRAEYVSLRAAARDSLDGQIALARWCRKNDFNDEAEFHWRAVLVHQPNNEEALRALGVRWNGGRLMSPAEIQAAKAAFRESKRAAKEFAPQMARWERLLAAGDVKSRDLAINEIRSLRETPAISAVEEVTLDVQLTTNDKFERSLEVGQAFVAALDQMPDRAATQSLVRHAVFAPVKSVRTAAITALKQRPPHDYVPQLLASLTMPIESSHRIVTGTDGSVHYFQSLYREGPTADWSFEGRLSAMQHDLQGPIDVTVDDRIRNKVTTTRFAAPANPAVVAEMASVAAVNRRNFAAKANAAEQQVAAINQATAAANRMILPVLVATTGKNFGDSPHAWWDWWQRYNEYSTDTEHPVRESSYADSTHQYYRPPEDHAYRIDPPPPPRPPGSLSCFAAGTLVWTKTGQQQIETLEIGDLVLAQDVDTGELAYKPVIGRTVRPPTEIRALTIDKDEIRATLGHPFWVSGVGWRMTKELADGAVLHGVNGPLRVDEIAPADESEAYNLIVADFNTYFVGQNGILVHDNTPRQPTAAKLPGLACD